jgi:uncharacterized linocin/CFP29 family protein
VPVIDVTELADGYGRPPVEEPPPIETMPPAGRMAPPATNLGREKLTEWDESVWGRIDDAVASELDRACVVTRFLPTVSPPSDDLEVPADRIDAVNGFLSIDKSKHLPLLELSEPFLLSKEQYHAENRKCTASTLASRAANRLARAIDIEIFQGQANPNLVETAKANHVVKVDQLANPTPGVLYGENSFAAVTKAYAFLQGENFYGPYALVASFKEFADAFAPLPTTLIMPADRIRPLMTAGFFGTGTLPKKTAIMLSTGGGTVDVARTIHAATAYTQQDDDENRRFRVYERFTVRIKVPEALVLLRYE